MKKIRSVFSAIAILVGVTAAFAFRSADQEGTQIFRLDPQTGALLGLPQGVPAEPGYICEQNPDLFCTQVYNVDESGNPTTPAEAPQKGQYIAP